jgi:hypothetical protein
MHINDGWESSKEEIRGLKRLVEKLCVDWIEVAQDGVQCQAILSKEMKFESYKDK